MPSLSPRAGAEGSDPDHAAINVGGPVFARASTFVRRRAGHASPDLGGGHGVDAARRGEAEAPRRWFLDLRGAAAFVRLVRAEPVLDVALTASAAGDGIRQALAGRTLGVPRNRVCAAVLTVAPAVPERPSGNRNRALRAALNVVAAADVTLRRVVDPAEQREVAVRAARLAPRLASWSTEVAGRPDLEWWVAESRGGDVVGLATVVVDAQWASLVTLVGFGEGHLASSARFALHHAIVRRLSAAGVRHLAALDDSPLLLAPGPQHLQRVMGYRVARLRRPTLLAAPAATSRTRPEHAVRREHYRLS